MDSTVAQQLRDWIQQEVLPATSSDGGQPAFEMEDEDVEESFSDSVEQESEQVDPDAEPGAAVPRSVRELIAKRTAETAGPEEVIDLDETDTELDDTGFGSILRDLQKHQNPL